MMIFMNIMRTFNWHRVEALTLMKVNYQIYNTRRDEGKIKNNRKAFVQPSTKKKSFSIFLVSQNRKFMNKKSLEKASHEIT